MDKTQLDHLYSLFLQIGRISTDSRDINPEVLFFALKGPNFNGNTYAKDALEKGASYVVIDEPEFQENDRFILVEDVLQCLQELARKHRQTFDIPFIGITGSNGKTTTKALIERVLSKKKKTYVTPKNFNNHIGVPLTILGIPSDTEIAVIELGANHVGEITMLCGISQPTHGMITNIGKDHLEGFGSFEGSLRANSELYQFLIQNNGLAFVNSQDPILMKMSNRLIDPIFYPGMEDFSRTTYLGSDPFVNYTNEKGEEVQTQMIGAYNFENLASAVCIGKFFGIGSGLIDEAISSYIPVNNRSQWLDGKSNKILLDAYNANPSSMEAAIISFAGMKKSPKMVILGDMFEMGDYSRAEHANLGKLISETSIEKVLLCGKDMQFAKENLHGAEYFESRNQLVDFLKKQELSGFLVLIKGSRGMALENCVEYL